MTQRITGKEKLQWQALRWVLLEQYKWYRYLYLLRNPVPFHMCTLRINGVRILLLHFLDIKTVTILWLACVYFNQGRDPFKHCVLLLQTSGYSAFNRSLSMDLFIFIAEQDQDIRPGSVIKVYIVTGKVSSINIKYPIHKLAQRNEHLRKWNGNILFKWWERNGWCVIDIIYFPVHLIY